MTATNSSNSWSSCPPGVLHQLDRRLRGQKRSKLMRESAALIVSAACIGFIAGYLATPSAPSPGAAEQYFFAGIGCNDVRSSIPALIGQRLDPDTAMRVRQHLMECPKCRLLMQQMQSMQSSGRDSRVPFLSSRSDAPGAS